MNFIYEVHESIERFNPISGHRWTENGKLLGYDVAGGKWIRTFHRSYDKALKEKEVRDSIDKKFPDGSKSD